MLVLQPKELTCKYLVGFEGAFECCGSECDVVEEGQILTFKPYLGLYNQNNSVVITTEGSSIKTKTCVIIIKLIIYSPHLQILLLT